MSLKHFIVATLYLIFIVFLLVDTNNYAQSFEIGWNEACEIFEIKRHVFLDYINPKMNELSISDRGPILPEILRYFKDDFGNQYQYYRYISIFFYFVSLILVFFIGGASFSLSERAFTSVLLAFNYEYFNYATVTNPYSLSLVLVLILYISHFKFKPTMSRFAIHAFLSFFNVITFFTSLLPVVLSLGILLKKYGKRYRYYFLLYLPFLGLTLVKAYQTLWFRFVVRVDESFYQPFSSIEMSLIQIGELLGVYLQPSFYSFSVTGIALIIGLITSVVYLVYFHIKLIRAKKLNFLSLYLLGAYLSFFIMKAYGAAEIETRYYFPLLPLFYLALSRHIHSFKSQILAAIVTLSLLLPQYYYRKNLLKPNIAQPLNSTLDRILPMADLEKDVMCIVQPVWPTFFAKEVVSIHPLTNKVSNESVVSFTKCSQNPKFLMERRKIFVVSYEEKIRNLEGNFPALENEIKMNRRLKAKISLNNGNKNDNLANIIVYQ